MENISLKSETQVKHLGNVLSTDLRDKCDIDYKKGCFYSSVNKVISMFRFLQCNTKQRLFCTYPISILCKSDLGPHQLLCERHMYFLE